MAGLDSVVQLTCASMLAHRESYSSSGRRDSPYLAGSAGLLLRVAPSSSVSSSFDSTPVGSTPNMVDDQFHLIPVNGRKHLDDLGEMQSDPSGLSVGRP